MVAIRVRFDGKALIPENPVELPQDRTLIVHVEGGSDRPVDKPVLRPVVTPSDPDATRRLIQDPESAAENF
jgi:hypothetical protein